MQAGSLERGEMSKKVTWTGSNNSSYLNGERGARTILGAVRAAIRYGNSELYGEGTLSICEDGDEIRRYEAGLLAGTARGVWRRTI